MKKFISGLKEKVDGGTSQPKGSTGSTPPHPAARGVQAQKPIQNGKGPALYPAEVLRVERLGFLDDTNNIFYPRDIGRSSWTPDGQGVVIQFGDTFVWDGPEGNPKNNFMGVAVNTAAVVQNPKTQPTKSHYMDLHSNGMVPVIPPYATGEGDPPVDQFGVAQTHIRTGLWCSGGIVFGEVNGDIAKGYCFFEKTHIGKGEFTVDILHTEYAIAELNLRTHQFSMHRPLNGGPFFTNKEPSFGAFSALYDEGYAYLYGGIGKGGADSVAYLARVPYSSITDRSAYEFWDGTSYQGDVSKSVVLFKYMVHGSIHKSKLFAPNTGKDYVFIGCSFICDSKVHIGTAPRPEGPWDMRELFRADPDLKKHTSTYCMFAHPWAFSEEDGELMISWSEGSMAGKVVAAKVTLKKEP